MTQADDRSAGPTEQRLGGWRLAALVAAAAALLVSVVFVAVRSRPTTGPEQSVVVLRPPSPELKAARAVEPVLAAASAQPVTSRLPDWLPRARATRPLGERSFFPNGGSFSFETNQTMESLLDHYEEQLSAAGFKVERELMTQSSGSLVAILSGLNETNGRGVTVTSVLKGGLTRAQVAYTGR